MLVLPPLAALIACTGTTTTTTTTTTPTADTAPTTPTTPTADTSPPTPTGDTGPFTPPEGPTWSLHSKFDAVVYVSWEQVEADDVSIEYSFDKGVWHASPVAPAKPGTNERVLVGIPYDTTADWRIVGTKGTTDVTKNPIVTGAAPNDMPPVTFISGDEKAWYQDGNYLLTSVNEGGGWRTNTYWTVIMDRQGRVVWTQKAPNAAWTLFAQVALSGDHIMWDEASYWSTSAALKHDGLIHRQYLDDPDPFDTIDAEGLQHAWVQLPNGTIAWGSKAHGGGEAIVERAAGATDVTVVWDCVNDWPGVNFCSSNGLFYNPSRDTYLFSFYTNSSIVEIDRSDGTSRWWAGNAPNGLDFSPEDSSVLWQHGITWTDAGTILVSSDTNDSARDTMVREYTLDEKKGVLTEIWSYNPGVRAWYNGDAWRLPNGNTIHGIGAAGEIREVDAKGTTVWHVEYPETITNGQVAATHMVGRVEFIEDLYALTNPTPSSKKPTAP